MTDYRAAIDAALAAFAVDDRYAARMARTARRILRQRARGLAIRQARAVARLN